MFSLASFLISLAISIACSVIAYLLAPSASDSSSVTADELDSPTAEEGIPIPHVRGTRFVSVNCVWWTPTGTVVIKK